MAVKQTRKLLPAKAKRKRKKKRRRRKKKKNKNKPDTETNSACSKVSNAKSSPLATASDYSLLRSFLAKTLEVGEDFVEIIEPDVSKSNEEKYLRARLRHLPSSFDTSSFSELCGPDGTINLHMFLNELPNPDVLKSLLPPPLVVREARDLCEVIGKLRFKADDLHFRLQKIMDEVKKNAFEEPPTVRVGVVTNLWQFLQSANDRVADRHATLVNSLRIQQSNVQRSRNMNRQRIQLRKIEGLNRSIKDCQTDATVFNCIVSVFGKTSIYAQLQNIKDTKYVTNSQGEVVMKVDDNERVLSGQKESDSSKKSLSAEEDVFGQGSLLSMLHDDENDDEDLAMNDAIRRNRFWHR